MEYTKDNIKVLKEIRKNAGQDQIEYVVENLFDALDEITRLQSLTQWVPVTERLPDIPKLGVPKLLECVDIHNKYYSPVVFTYDKEWNYNDGERWRIISNSVVIDRWRELPPEGVK